METIERQQEREEAEIVQARHLEAKEIQKVERAENAKHFQQIWEAQKQLKENDNLVEKVF